MNSSTNFSRTQKQALRKNIEAGLSVLAQPDPQTCVEWANENFYLSSESSYSEGKWQTAPFQVAILNAMGNDDINVVDLIKSARIGYTKMLVATMGYMAEHKKRNQMLWQPTDAGAGEFMKQHVETMIRDVPTLRALAPWMGNKDRDNTLDYKRFSNRKQIFVKGGASAKNYREKSVDTVYFDELSSFDPDIEREGDALTLGDKRTEGSVYPKSIRGSTPKTLPECQISQAVDEAEERFVRFVPCPHCGEEQALTWGEKDSDHGLKFEYKENAKKKKIITKSFYLCKHCAAIINNNQLFDMDSRGRYISESGTWTKDGIAFFDEKDHEIETPKHIAFHVWTIFSPWSPWSKICQDFLNKKENPTKLKAWVNTTLGEAWIEKGEKLEHDHLYARREYYKKKVPAEVYLLAAGVDVQDDRLEVSLYGFGGLNGQETWLITHDVFRGDPGKPNLWKRLNQFLIDSYEHENGMKLRVAAVAVDTGGHYTQTVYKFCKARESRNVFAIKGKSTRGAPIAGRPSKSNSVKCNLYAVGTDTAKDLIYARLRTNEPGAGYVHFPMGEPMVDEEFFEQLTAEKRVTKYKNGFPYREYVKTRGRNEAIDCAVYALAAVEILNPNFKALKQTVKRVEKAKPETPSEDDLTPGKMAKKRKTARIKRRKKNFIKG
ncbi:MAG: phage terminase large subunit family protein [Planctomycetaceae bacterium]|nr:phage terminase large subunit family protein [Planctomycetaceae bacterium]